MRRLFRVRVELIEGRCKPTSGLVYQELPRALLANGMFERLRPAIAYLQSIVPRIDKRRVTFAAVLAEG